FRVEVVDAEPAQLPGLDVSERAGLDLAALPLTVTAPRVDEREAASARLQPAPRFLHERTRVGQGVALEAADVDHAVEGARRQTAQELGDVAYAKIGREPFGRQLIARPRDGGRRPVDAAHREPFARQVPDVRAGPASGFEELHTRP